MNAVSLSPVTRFCFCLLLFIALSGCSRVQIKEADLQRHIDAQLPVTGLVSAKVELPKEFAGLSDALGIELRGQAHITAQVELTDLRVNLSANRGGRLDIVAHSRLSSDWLGAPLTEAVTLFANSGLRYDDAAGALYLDELSVTDLSRACSTH